ncbi:MAG: Gfo/Idh/MocA family oxidoreductase [Acidimicrobiia bacterium]
MADVNHRLRVALVGANASGRGWGPAAHIPAIAAVEQLELVALCTSSPTSAAAAAETYGIPRAYHDVRELAAQSDIDLVTVAVRVPHHHSIVMPLLEAGKNVYCEWPLGTTVEEAEEMATAAEASGVTAVVGLQGRHDPALSHVRELVDDGWVGDVLSVNVTMIGGGALAHRANEAWMANDAKGANTLTIVAGHTLDHVEYLFGKLTEVSATVGVQVPQWRLVDTGETVEADAPDNILLNGTLAGGVLLSFQVASVPYNGSGWRMEAYGTEGTLVASSAALPQITPISLLGARGTDPLAPLDVPVSEPDGLAVPTGPGHNIARSYARMAQAIRKGASAKPDFSDAVRVHRLLDSVRASSAKREAIGVGA